MGLSTLTRRPLRQCRLARLLALLSALLAPAVSAVVERSQLSGMKGSVRSPGYPNPYPNEVEQKWSLAVPPGYRVRLHFTSFDLETSFECHYDHLKVEVTTEILGLFCGRQNGATAPERGLILTPGNTVDLTFVSDFSNEHRHTGFEVYFTAVDIDECAEYTDEMACEHSCLNYPGGFECSCQHGYVLAADSRSCTVECSGIVFTERQGVITSPEYPNPYPRALQCKFTLRLEEGFVFNLAFKETFDVETHPEVNNCPYDSLTIRSSENEWGPYCGTTLPEPIKTKSYEVDIIFTSDASRHNTGWKLSYTSEGVPCLGLKAPAHGTFAPVRDAYSFKDQVVFSCDVGYQMIQKENIKEVIQVLQVECQKNGKWSKQVPTCQIVNCGTPEQPKNGYCSSPDVTTYKENINCGCIEPYDFPKNIDGVFTCNESGYWINPKSGEKIPKCEFVCGEPKNALSEVSRVVGGRRAQSGNFPWQVYIKLLSNGRLYTGGGALLGERWVLTAAHLVQDFLPNETVIVLGALNTKSTNKLGTTDVRTVDKIISHPGYNLSLTGYDNDIALIRLAGDVVTMTETIIPICLPYVRNGDVYPQLIPDHTAYVSGWGRTASTGPVSNVLQYVDLPVVTQDECSRANTGRLVPDVNWNTTVSENMFCAGYPDGSKDSCQGDSGGPISIVEGKSWYVVGVVSWGLGCAQVGQYGVYTRVHKYLDWLHSEMAERNVKTEH